MASYLGIDFGTKRIGLAWADDLGVSLPAGAVPGVGQVGCWDAISDQIKQRSITEIVVGYPIHMDGKIGQRAIEVDAFIVELQNRFGLPIHRVDERLTSLSARQSLGGKSSKKGRDKSGRIDATAACLILRDFLNS